MTALLQYERACAALAEASRIEDVLPLLDEFALARKWAQQIDNSELLAKATEWQLKAERRLGEIIIAAKEAGLFKQGQQRKGSAEELSSRPTLAEAGIDKKLSARAQKRAFLPQSSFDTLISDTRERIYSGKAKIIDADPINGARSIMSSRKAAVDEPDFYPTPPFATRALFEHVFGALPECSISSIWEPACGEGHMAEVLREYCPNVFASDLHDYGYGETLDFLSKRATSRDFDYDMIITNPPFGEKTEQFALRALDQAKVGVALFVRLQWLETIGRYERLFRRSPPTLISFFCERVNLSKGRWEPDGGTATAYIWLVWLKDAYPRAPFWIPPGCRKSLERIGDREHFTAHPVLKRASPEKSEKPIPVRPDFGPLPEIEIPELLRESI